METFSQLGALGLGSRLKRLGDILMTEVEKIYAAYGLDLKPACFPLLWTLKEHGSLPVTALAEQLGVSHPAVSQSARLLLKDGWITEQKDSADERRRLLTLSDKSSRLLAFLEPLWGDIRSDINERLAALNGDLLGLLADLENNLTEKPLAQQVQSKIQAREGDDISIVGWDPAFKSAYKELNEEWIQDYFTLEDKDREVLGEPEKYILARGGEILFATDGTAVLGTCVIIPSVDGVFELTKMAVSKAARGRRIGIRLCKAALEYAKKRGGIGVFLESHHSLKPALAMYEKLGFKHQSPPRPSAYARADVYMYRDL